MGWTAAARRKLSGPTSDKAMWRTYPAWTISAMAPIVSSTGTSGLRRPGR